MKNNTNSNNNSEEECKPCKLNIGAAMMVVTCKDINKNNKVLNISCDLLEKELVEKEEKVAGSIINTIYNEVMKKGNEKDKEVIQEIYDLSYEK